MSAPSLYRRHRPRSFDDVVGQEHVVRTLRNALEQDKVHHAYLFVGSRGTGKTSMAKILAACLNCQGDPDLPPGERVSGPTTQPCGKCEPCRSIADATSIDVVEMDAASNNSVDDIRDLRDSVAFSPVGGRHKVYILDEAHMLSSAAWNAFLKTLEEPPPRTIFVLATTEANKVLPTVVDRCHRFDFHRPTPDQLARVLVRVAHSEGFTVSPEAIALVARHATGSFRDALGTLEQLVTYAGSSISTDDVLNVLGVADAELLFRAFDAVAAGDAAAAIGVAADLSAQGRDLVQVTRDVESHARALLLVRMVGALPDELRISPDRDTRTVEQAQRLAGATVIRVLDLVAAALAAVRDGADPRTQLELLLIRAALPQIDPQTKALAARIVRLEQVGAGALPGVPVPGAPQGVAVPQGAAGSQVPAAPQASPTDASVSRAGAPGEPVAVPRETPAGQAESAPGSGPGAVPQDAPAGPAESAPGSGPGAVPQETPAADQPRTETVGAATPDQHHMLRPGPPTPAPDVAGAAGPTAAPPGPSAASAGAPDSTVPQAAAPAPASTQADPPPPAAQADPPQAAPEAVAPPQAAPSQAAPGTLAPPQAASPQAAPQQPDRSQAASQQLAPPQPAAPQAPPELGVSPTDVDELLPTIGDRMPGNAVKAALGQARTVQVGAGTLVLGLPAGKASSARLLNRDDSRAAIVDALEELLGVRYEVRAEERAGLATPEEPLLPEDEVVRRVVLEFEAEEVAGGTSAPATTPSNGDA